MDCCFRDRALAGHEFDRRHDLRIGAAEFSLFGQGEAVHLAGGHSKCFSGALVIAPDWLVELVFGSSLAGYPLEV